ncbi:hypothetical protein EV426DRAFT_677562 [Tirmania nivea]|nr:hypothetical protein EV426DRAFT_677562 [Tirmania nivea]
MASRTDSGSPPQKARSPPAPSLKLKRSAALIYNYVKPKTNRSATDTHLFQKVSSVISAMSDLEKAAMLRPDRATRSGTGPPIPSPRDIREFEAMVETWTSHGKRSPLGELTPKPPKRSKKVNPPTLAITRVDPHMASPPSSPTPHAPPLLPPLITDPPAEPCLAETAERIAESSLEVTAGQREQSTWMGAVPELQQEADDPSTCGDTTIFLHENKPKKTVKRIAGSVVAGARSTVGGITKAASGALQWLNQTGFEELGRNITDDERYISDGGSEAAQNTQLTAEEDISRKNEEREARLNGQLPAEDDPLVMGTNREKSPNRTPSRTHPFFLSPKPKFGDLEFSDSSTPPPPPAVIVHNSSPPPPLPLPLPCLLPSRPP